MSHPGTPGNTNGKVRSPQVFTILTTMLAGGSIRISREIIDVDQGVRGI